MATPRSEVYAAVDSERDYQKKWDKEDPKGEHSVTEFLLYMQDYLNQAITQVTRNPSRTGEAMALHTMRKIAGLSVACMEQHGAPLREEAALRVLQGARRTSSHSL